MKEFFDKNGMCEFTLVKAGDEVFSIEFGWGVVIYSEWMKMRILIAFNVGGDTHHYTYSGHLYNNGPLFLSKQDLFWGEIKNRRQRRPRQPRWVNNRSFRKMHCTI